MDNKRTIVIKGCDVSFSTIMVNVNERSGDIFAAVVYDTTILSNNTYSNASVVFVTSEEGDDAGSARTQFTGEYEYIIKSGEGQFPFSVQDNTLEIAVPRKLLNKTRKEVSFAFKWADNPTNPIDIISVSTSGDTAPNRRFAYRFVWRR